MRRRTNLGTDLLKGALAGLVATWVMERVTTYLYEHEGSAARQREDEARQGKHAFTVAAEKTTDLTGISLSEDQQQRLGMAYHWGLGLGAGALYAALRRRVGRLDSGKEPRSASSFSSWWTKR